MHNQHSMASLFVISGPSGAGKTSLVQAVLKVIPRLILSISTTTRPKRPGEQDGINYHFVSETVFQSMIDNQQFLEYARVFDYYYGTPIKKVVEKLEQNKPIILEIDWQGAQTIRENFGCPSIFILPPDKDTLHNRLIGRQQDKLDTIKQRLAQAKLEISHYKDFDYLIVNQNFETTITQLCAIINANDLTCARQSKQLASLLNQLLND